MKSSLTISSISFDLMIPILVIGFGELYKTILLVTLVIVFIIADLRAMTILLFQVEDIGLNPYIYGVLIIHPYTHIAILYKLSEYDKYCLLKSILTLGCYNGIWIDRLIKKEVDLP